jgi:hypothetical protein
MASNQHRTPPQKRRKQWRLSGRVPETSQGDNYIHITSTGRVCYPGDDLDSTTASPTLTPASQRYRLPVEVVPEEVDLESVRSTIPPLVGSLPLPAGFPPPSSSQVAVVERPEEVNITEFRALQRKVASLEDELSLLRQRLLDIRLWKEPQNQR